MSDLEALYRAVLASPDEDTPRLIYADCVEERGDEARAALIRAQCEIARAGWPLPDVDRSRWEPVCVVCNGQGYLQHWRDGIVMGSSRCRTCNGTGRQPCRWERGFPVVQVAEMRQVWEHIDHGRVARWQPTPWLCDLIRTHHVAGVVPGGAVQQREYAPGDVRPTVYKTSCPPRVWGKMKGVLPEQQWEGERAEYKLGRAVVLAALEWLDAQGEK